MFPVFRTKSAFRYYRAPHVSRPPKNRNEIITAQTERTCQKREEGGEDTRGEGLFFQSAENAEQTQCAEGASLRIKPLITPQAFACREPALTKLRTAVGAGEV